MIGSGAQLLSPMKIAQYSFEQEDWGSEDDPKSDWNLAQIFNTYSHTTECEFIFAIGYDKASREFELDKYKQAGFSENFLNIIKTAQALDYDYICIYT